LEQVARVAGVSLATASRVLNGGARRPREELRQRVLAAVRTLNYSPNANAQAVARGLSDIVGLVVHDISDPYFASIASGVMREADRHGLVVTVTDTRRDPEREIAYVAALRRQRARAILLAGTRTTDARLTRQLGEELEAYRSFGGRVALISQHVFGIDTIQVLNQQGGADLAEALYGLGYRRFALLPGPPALRTPRDRVAGFRRALTAHDVTVEPGDIVNSDFSRDGGYEAMTRLLAQGTRAHCVFAANDVMAVGAMAAIRAAGLHVPGDVAVAGFDDIVTLRDIMPSLTTVHIPLEELGTRAVELVVDPSPQSPRTRRVRGGVVLRDSTPPLGAAGP
jgi:LacI family transcriptional regulator